jgi:hypothetical protein
MKHFCWAALFLLNSASVYAHPGEFVTERYQQPDGAITLDTTGVYVDPYFATKALLTAHAEGLDIRRPAEAWIAWLLPRQISDGRFERYCRTSKDSWRSCETADADDALLALWLELLYTLAPDGSLPPRWRESARLAERHLASLRDPRRGVYHVSSAEPVALLMDNVEIYASFSAIVDHQKRLGLFRQAQRTAIRATSLRHAIIRVFWKSDLKRYRVTTQKRQSEEFYPDTVAQIYPWFAGLAAPSSDGREQYMHWREQYARGWLSLQQDEYPWGLVALASLRFQDRVTAYRWFEQAAPLRHGQRWNILEEAVYQVITFDRCCRSDPYRNEADNAPGDRG